jgi:DNA-binding NarL/FixJ family response regulator
VGTSSAISPRPLTDAERATIQRAHSRIPEAEEMARELVRRAVAERDAEITAAVRAGASQTDIAEAIGVSRQAIYNAIKRSEDR